MQEENPFAAKYVSKSKQKNVKSGSHKPTRNANNSVNSANANNISANVSNNIENSGCTAFIRKFFVAPYMFIFLVFACENLWGKKFDSPVFDIVVCIYSFLCAIIIFQFSNSVNSANTNNISANVSNNIESRGCIIFIRKFLFGSFIWIFLVFAGKNLYGKTFDSLGSDIVLYIYSFLMTIYCIFIVTKNGKKI